MWPCVSTVSVAQYAVGVFEFERLEDVFSVVTHVLGISKF